MVVRETTFPIVKVFKVDLLNIFIIYGICLNMGIIIIKVFNHHHFYLLLIFIFLRTF
jgi:hypothetical protein